VLACVYFFLVNWNKEWVPNMDFIFYSTDLYESDIARQYWNSIYHSVMLFGINEMTPRLTIEVTHLLFLTIYSLLLSPS